MIFDTNKLHKATNEMVLSNFVLFLFATGRYKHEYFLSAL